MCSENKLNSIPLKIHIHIVTLVTIQVRSLDMNLSRFKIIFILFIKNIGIDSKKISLKSSLEAKKSEL